MNVVLLSTYDLGRQPFGLASPAAWLRRAGADVVCNDLAVEPLDEAAVRAARLIAVYLPMHTATRLAIRLAPRLKALNPQAHLCFYGLYAPMNAALLRAAGAETILGGEFESGLVRLYDGLTGERADGAAPDIALVKQRFLRPERSGLAPLSRYARLDRGDGAALAAGHTEASRGCKHLCRHCPVVPVYGGRFFIVQREVVVADIAQQVAAGARHISFGDPDFFNGVGHAMRIVTALHEAFPALTYDVTIKIEHLLRHGDRLPALAETGCLFITSAVESFDDRVLALLDKGHDRADILRAAALVDAAGIALSPTFLPFTPWTTPASYLDLLRELAALGLVARVAPVQLAIRLLVPRGSRLLDLAALRAHLGAFDAASLSYRWSYADPRSEALYREVSAIVAGGVVEEAPRAEIFAALWAAAHRAGGVPVAPVPIGAGEGASAPSLSEPWYCCAEPTDSQLAAL